ncbi:hypothetical protein GW17_00054482 [Ensete ventricosum]|nr:hypothetical protein GW17_00054482 [Ensete ventricosum]
MKTTIRVLVCGSSLIVNGRVVVLRGAIESLPLLDRGPSIGFTRRGAVPTRRGSADYDVDLMFDQVDRTCPGTLRCHGRIHGGNEYLPLSLSSGLVLMRFGGARSPFPLIWRKILVRVELRGVVGGRGWLKFGPLNPPPRRSRGRSLRLFHSWTLLFFTFSDDQGLDSDEVVCPLHHLGDYGRRFLDQRPK